MEYINVTKENLENEHICCAISNNKDVQVSSQKTWLSDRMDDGLVFFEMFFASTFWTKLQNIFGHCCMSKLDKVAKRWPVMIRPAI